MTNPLLSSHSSHSSSRLGKHIWEVLHLLLQCGGFTCIRRIGNGANSMWTSLGAIILPLFGTGVWLYTTGSVWYWDIR